MTEQTKPELIAPELSSGDGVLPIREVVRLTGVNPVTLRAWERRYGLIRPVRSEGGHRLYSCEDVAAIRSIVSWTERGVSVSKVGALLAHSKSRESNVQHHCDSRVASASNADDLALSHAQQGQWPEWQACIREAVAAFNGPHLEHLYSQLLSVYPMSLVFEEILLPVWQQQLQQVGFGKLSQWLFYDAFLRARVLLRLQMNPRSNTSENGCVLLAAMPGQCRELELLVTGLLIGRDSGWVQVLALGQPLNELPLVCQAIHPEALVLLAPAPLSGDFLRELNQLAFAIDCPLALAGVGAELVEDQLKGSAIANLGSDTRLMLSRLRQFVDGHLDT
ncbi:MerR family transcriptional regulator [Pseudomonas sp. BBP2017]|uniref:MerR family transcriptional regulator n=1 Tax=Pseudomonas sp. BBP2017 TaxID=2109731 RepID=UPI000D119977|nr:MerR family transcriptional regulator [Pseudomonas sp. BBP2017]PSS58764.1 helix-turn-helix-type transcriptional regulator [Pseudomonas sp. BBP2017]